MIEIHWEHPAQQATVEAIKAHFGEPAQQFGDYTKAENLYYGFASIAVYPDGRARVKAPDSDQHTTIALLYVLKEGR